MQGVLKRFETVKKAIVKKRTMVDLKRFMAGISKLLLASFLTLTLTLLLYIVSFGTTHWTHGDSQLVERTYISKSFYYIDTAIPIDVNIGIWSWCLTVKNTSKIFNCSSVIDYLKANNGDLVGPTRAFQGVTTIVLLIYIAAAITLGLRVFLLKDRQLLLRASTALNATAAILLLVAISVYAAFIQKVTVVKSATYNFSFVFSILAMLASFAAEALMIIERILARRVTT